MPGLNFNHAMIYSRNVAAGSEFYQRLGLEVLEAVDYNGMRVYARLKAPEGEGTIALHMLERGKELQPGAIRLYFETRNLEALCKRLEKAGMKFTKPPAQMPWGWKHAYLDDPDGHEVSLYWAGSKRLKKSRPVKPRP
jgi:predicted enzyme related to lactoylglutathione lyase